LYQKGSCKLDCNWQPNGTANLDNCLRCVNGNTGKTACVLSCSGNLIKTNAGFESNNLTDWTGWGTRAVSSTAFSGKYGVQVDNGSVERVITVEPFMKYTFKVKAKKTGAGWYRLGSKDHGVTESFTEFANTNWADAIHTFTTGNTTSVRLYFYNGGGGSLNGDDFVLQPSGCLVTASEDEEEKDEVNIYPNPSSNYFKIETKELGKIQIFSLSGMLLEEHLLNPSQQYGTNLESSTYVVKFITNTNTKIFKWVKN
jgi:Carbohydrate binding domain/Secretion system C-terminal sorting domain